jgi:hypothetical protein
LTDLIAIFQAVDKEPETIVKYKDNKAFYACMHYGFKPTAKFNLPETDPPYVSVTVSGNRPSKCIENTWKLWRYFCANEMRPILRERTFIEMLECYSEPEALLLLAVKDQNIERMFPNITRELVTSKFLP